MLEVSLDFKEGPSKAKGAGNPGDCHQCDARVAECPSVQYCDTPDPGRIVLVLFNGRYATLTETALRCIACIRRVGARDVRGGRCGVCRTYATGDAVLAHVHIDDTEYFIFYTDDRAFGRGFDEYLTRGAEEYGIEYARARPGEIAEGSETKNLQVSYDDTESGGVKSMEFDTVVLSTTFFPPPGTRSLGEKFGVEMDECIFFDARDDLLAPMDTNVQGIHIAGACTRPMDFADVMTNGEGAARGAARAI